MDKFIRSQKVERYSRLLERVTEESDRQLIINLLAEEQQKQKDVALLRAIKALEKLKVHNDDQRTGIEIVKKAMSWPARQIAINAGEDGSIVVGKIMEKDAYAFGYDAQTGEYGNLVSKGIIDPRKVVRVALQGAASIAGLQITTEAMVAELPKKDSPAMPGGGGGMGGMGGMDY
jgi:chaperonin GroEL